MIKFLFEKDLIIGIFSIVSYGYAMFILPVSATAFMINLNQKYPVIEPYLPYAIDGKSSLGVDSVDSTPFKFLVKWWLSISQTS